MDTLIMMTVYENVKDIPTHRYCVRSWITQPGNSVPGKIVMKTDEYLAIERTMTAMGRVRLSRDKDDDPCIVETWI